MVIFFGISEGYLNSACVLTLTATMGVAGYIITRTKLITSGARLALSHFVLIYCPLFYLTFLTIYIELTTDLFIWYAFKVPQNMHIHLDSSYLPLISKRWLEGSMLLHGADCLCLTHNQESDRECCHRLHQCLHHLPPATSSGCAWLWNRSCNVRTVIPLLFLLGIA